MANEEGQKLRCYLSMPISQEFEPVKKAVIQAAENANFELMLNELQPNPESRMPDLRLSAIDSLYRIISDSDVVIQDITNISERGILEIGIALGLGKAVFATIQGTHLVRQHIRSELFIFYYEISIGGLEILTTGLQTALEQFAVTPNNFRPFSESRQSPTFFVDWDKLDRRDTENLCRELLMQMGFRNVDWSKRKSEIDIIAEYPKKDPDGFEYSDFWLISMGRKFPLEEFVYMASREYDYFLRDILRGNERESSLLSRSTITFLLILFDDDFKIREMIQDELEHRGIKSRSLNPRFRVWDRNYLTLLVQQHPQIGYKYFSDEGFSRLKYRKTPEELYEENRDLSNRQTKLIAELQEEKNMRVRAERDAVWKDISFSAAHKIGNPIFAIETNLNPLQKRVDEDRKEEAVEVISNIRTSVEKAKGIVDQFKSLTSAQEIKPVSTLLKPILEDACKTAQSCYVVCEIDCPDELKLEADPERLAECFDELASNTIHWFDKEEKNIQIRVTNPAPFVPSFLDSSRQYVLIHFKDNGLGIKIENKEKIFDAFVSTRNHGTGLGLALVRRIIEGHGGAVSEIGIPSEGADFEIYLPLPSDKSAKRPRRRKKE